MIIPFLAGRPKLEALSIHKVSSAILLRVLCKAVAHLIYLGASFQIKVLETSHQQCYVNTNHRTRVLHE